MHLDVLQYIPFIPFQVSADKEKLSLQEESLAQQLEKDREVTGKLEELAKCIEPLTVCKLIILWLLILSDLLYIEHVINSPLTFDLV